MAELFVLPLADVGAGLTPSDGSKLFFSETGLSFDANPKATFSDITAATSHANPVLALGTGVFPAIYLTGTYRAVLKDKNDVQIWVVDNINSQGFGNTAWVSFAGIPTQTSSTTFTLTGDQTSTFQVGRRVRLDDGSTLYGTITVSAFTSLTTVTVLLDSGSISGSLTAVSFGLLSVINPELVSRGLQYLPDVTGAVTTDVQTKLRQIVSVSDFGVVGDGVTDDSTALQAAINATTSSGSGNPAGPITLHWPNATYAIGSNLIPDGTFNWLGASKQGVQLKALNSAVTEMVALPDSILGDTNITSRSSIVGMNFNGNSVATFAIKGYTNHLVMRDCRITATTSSATDISFGWSCLYDNVEVSNNTGDGITLLGSGSNNDVTVRDCKIFLNTGSGIKIGSGVNAVRIRGCALENNAAGAVFMPNAINNLSITQCYFEANANTGLAFTTPSETIKADIIINGSGSTTLGFGTSCKNIVIEDNFVASGGGTHFVYAAGLQSGSIKNNTLAPSGVSRLLGGYGNNAGSLTYGSFNGVDISGNFGFAKTYTGTHDGSSNVATLSDSTAPFVAGYLVGAIVKNVTDNNSYGLITANTTTTVTAALIGGTDTDWDASDAYEIVVPEVGLVNMPLAGTGSTLDVGGSFAGIQYDDASKMNIALADFNQWSIITGSAGTWSRSATVFKSNPNVSVWDLFLLSSGATHRRGFSLDMDDYPTLQGKFGLFTMFVKHDFSGDGNLLLYPGGTTDTPITSSDNTWQLSTSLFRFPVTGTFSFSIAKTGASGTCAVADPRVIELGSISPLISDIQEERYQFRGTAAPIAGTWKDGDTVYHSAPATGSPAAWTCTTAGTPGTWTAWANL